MITIIICNILYGLDDVKDSALIQLTKKEWKLFQKNVFYSARFLYS